METQYPINTDPSLSSPPPAPDNLYPSLLSGNSTVFAVHPLLQLCLGDSGLEATMLLAKQTNK